MKTPWEFWFDFYVWTSLEFWYIPYKIIGSSSI